MNIIFLTPPLFTLTPAPPPLFWGLISDQESSVLGWNHFLHNVTQSTWSMLKKIILTISMIRNRSRSFHKYRLWICKFKSCKITCTCFIFANFILRTYMFIYISVRLHTVHIMYIIGLQLQVYMPIAHFLRCKKQVF